MNLAKPQKHSQKKARRAAKGQEAVILKALRPAIDERDGYCRLYVLGDALRQEIWAIVGPCGGVSELAHYGEWRRSHTMKMRPEERHVRRGVLKLCAQHHRVGPTAYDPHLGGTRMQIEALTAAHTDGPMVFRVGEREWSELDGR